MNDRYVLDGHKAILEKDLMKWVTWLETADRKVRKTELPEGVEVSTVFLGLDHNFFGSGNPVLFETMVFGGKFDQEMNRYSTWEQAETRHEEMVEKVKAG